MKTGIGLGFICLGAILAFAVTTNTSVFNIHTAGWVFMIIGIIGLVLPRRTYGWLGRRVTVRRVREYPGEAEEVAVRPYVARNPGTSRIEAGLPSGPTLMTERPGDTEVIEDLYEPPDLVRKLAPAIRQVPP
ncbi:MAG TPA: hypothetical protein VH589_16905 [Trebonia sp.]|jgi:hypothetical protein